jgi:hypothetical protein
MGRQYKSITLRTWMRVMDIIWTLGGSVNGVRASKGGEAVQMERVATVRKAPKDGMMADVDS